MVNLKGMESKKNSIANPLVTLVCSTIICGSIIALCWGFTKDNVRIKDSDSMQYATEKDGLKIHERLLNVVSEATAITLPDATVDELVSITFKNDKLLVSCVASDINSKLCLFAFDAPGSTLDSSLQAISEAETFNISTLTYSEALYSLEDLSDDMKSSYIASTGAEGKNSYALAKNSITSELEFFATYKKSDTFYSISNATFTDNNLNLTNATQVSASRRNNSYLYWLLLKICA